MMKRNLIIAVVFVLILIVWMITGLSKNYKKVAEITSQKTVSKLFKVKAKHSFAEEVDKDVWLSAKTAPNRIVTLKSELNARIAKIAAERGSIVEADQDIVVLDERDLHFSLKQKEATAKQRSLEYKAIKDLFEKKMTSETQVANANSAMQEAQANLISARVDAENIHIKAPFAGKIQERPVELGDYVVNGDKVAVIIDNNPIIVVGDATERQVKLLNAGMPGVAILASGDILPGKIRYIAPQGSPISRTFRVELEIPNADRNKIVGETAKLKINTGRIKVHKISPSALTLNDSGQIGIKFVGQNNQVQFKEALIEKSTPSELWLSNLPEEIAIITVGQGFVNEGDEVAVELDESQTKS